MRTIAIIVFGVCLITLGAAQETNVTEVTSEPTIIVEFNKDSIIPNQKGLTVLYDLGKNTLTLEEVKEYDWIWVVVTCDYEMERNSLIHYKRAKYLIDFFEEKYDICRSNFEFTFLPPEECNPKNPYSLSKIQFTLGGCGGRKRG